MPRTLPSPARRYTEHEFASQVESLLTLRGWRWYHTWRSDNSAAGFPDYVAVRPPRVVFLEIKGWRSGGRRRGQPTDEQQAWLDGLQASGAEARIAWPEDLESLAEWLA